MKLISKPEIIKKAVMKKKTIFLALIMIFSVSLANAQDYRTGIGLRGGFFSGITFKHFVSQYNAVELVAAIHHRGPFIAGMYQMHTNAFDVPGLNWYYGPGAHVGFYQGRYRPGWFDEPGRNYVVLGVNGVVGLEYKIDEIPISLGLDITPALNIAEHFGFWIGGGITVRYVF
jgi:hypothetical protein